MDILTRIRLEWTEIAKISLDQTISDRIILGLDQSILLIQCIRLSNAEFDSFRAVQN